jgi:murein DD-endopeptidase MepM/ murein hydrolase activator NlpD
VYVFPIRPASAARFRPGHHDYPATDIRAPTGSTFVAVTSGVVDFVNEVDGWDPRLDDPATRGGLSVAIIGDDGVRYYGSHLSAIAPDVAPGVRVSAGQQLGAVGQSGDARFVAPHLHFGISHPTYPEDWAVRRGEIDPYPYLKAWTAGFMKTPGLGP